MEMTQFSRLVCLALAIGYLRKVVEPASAKLRVLNQPVGCTNGVREVLKAEIAWSKRERQQLLRRYKPTSPEIRTLDKQIYQLQNLLRQPQKTKPRLIPPSTQQTPVPHGSLSPRQYSLNSQLQRLLAQRNQLLREYRPGAPEIRAIDRQIAELRHQLRNQSRLPSGNMPQLIPPLHSTLPTRRFAPPATKPRYQLLKH